jgi:hypothetical protein
MGDDRSRLHPAEHRAYRELYLTSRQLVKRWGRLISALEGTPQAEVLERARGRVEELLAVLPAETERRGLYAGPMALGTGARLGDLRSVIADRTVDTGMVIRAAVLDIEHVATLLGQLGALAVARGDDELASFCRTWEAAIRPEVEAVRVAAASLGDSPERTAAPLDSSLLGRAAHGAGWVFGAVGEAVDNVTGRRRSPDADEEAR